MDHEVIIKFCFLVCLAVVSLLCEPFVSAENDNTAPATTTGACQCSFPTPPSLPPPSPPQLSPPPPPLSPGNSYDSLPTPPPPPGSDNPTFSPPSGGGGSPSDLYPPPPSRPNYPTGPAPPPPNPILPYFPYYFLNPPPPPSGSTRFTASISCLGFIMLSLFSLFL